MVVGAPLSSSGVGWCGGLGRLQIGGEGSMDHVGEVSFEASPGFGCGLAFGAFPGQVFGGFKPRLHLDCHEQSCLGDGDNLVQCTGRLASDACGRSPRQASMVVGGHFGHPRSPAEPGSSVLPRRHQAKQPYPGQCPTSGPAGRTRLSWRGGLGGSSRRRAQGRCPAARSMPTV